MNERPEPQPRVVAGQSGAAAAVGRLISRDRLIVGGGLVVLTALAWLYLVRTAADMRAMDAMGMPDMRVWMTSDLAALFLMWTVMMVAMMLPSAAPMILLTVGVYRRRGGLDARVAAPLFVAGYVSAWTAFSAAIALTQFALHRAALLSPDMATTSAVFGGALLIAAGAYQWSPVKGACLHHCRSPLAHLTSEWREGLGGALVMGLRHGLFCVGCCWTLMALLFVAGVMNLAWIAVIAGFVLIEKLAPAGARLGRAAGLLLAAWGVLVIARIV